MLILGCIGLLKPLHMTILCPVCNFVVFYVHDVIGQ